jgi:hypothetical protein
MCKCNPEIKTPFCGKPGCEWPFGTPAHFRSDRAPPSSNLVVALARFAQHPEHCPVAQWMPEDPEDFDCPDCTCGLQQLLDEAKAYVPRFPPETTADFDLIGAVKLAEEIIGRVCELPDRNSPDDEPDAMVCNASELEGCIVSVLENRWERATGRSVVKTGAEHG